MLTDAISFSLPSEKRTSTFADEAEVSFVSSHKLPFAFLIVLIDIQPVPEQEFSFHPPSDFFCSFDISLVEFDQSCSHTAV